MTNWCENVLILAHKDPSMVARAVEAFENGRLLEEFVPMPKEYLEAGHPSCDPKAERVLAKKHGYTDWHEWRVANWGCKWDVGGGDALALESNDPGRVELCFNSPWAPPATAYPALERLGFTVEAFYYDKGRSLCGWFRDGTDSVFEIKGGAEWVRANIPAVVDDAFAISDNLEDEEGGLDGGEAVPLGVLRMAAAFNAPPQKGGAHGLA